MASRKAERALTAACVRGRYFDGKRTQVIVDPTWNASKFVELGASYQLTRLRFDSRSQKDTIQLLGLAGART